VKTDDLVEISVSTENVHFFDAQTRERIH